MKDVTVPTPDTTWTTPSSAWQTESSTARSLRQRRAPRRRLWGVRRPQRCRCPRLTSSWFIGRNDWEGNNGNSVAMEDDDDAYADADAGEYTCDFLKVALRQL